MTSRRDSLLTLLSSISGMDKIAAEYNAPRSGGEKRWSIKQKRSIDCNNPRGFSQKQYCKRKSRGGDYKSDDLIDYSSDPKVGTGKKPKGSGRRLYTDEDPNDTCRVSFTSVSAIMKTLSSSCFKRKPHARQSQIINLIHQRVRAAYSNAKDPDVKKRLKRAFEYAEKRKEMSKKKTERIRKKMAEYEANNIEKFSGLDRWFKEKWVDISRKDKSGNYAPCGRSDSSKGKYPKCRPSKRVNKQTPVTTRELSDKEEKSAIRKKRKAEREKPSSPAGGGSRKPKRAPTIKKDSRYGELSYLFKIANETITSFDFDDTIRMMSGKVNKNIIPLIFEAKNRGKIYLVTAREDTKENVDFVINFLKDTKVDGISLFSLFDSFYFVGGIKADKLKLLGVSTHYDDNPVEISAAENNGINAIKI
jgi:hypothetical protein